MDIERELTEDEEIMLHGHCHFMALALHEATGFKLAAYLEFDDDIGRTALVHAFVVDGDEAIDVRGRMPLSDILEGEFQCFEPDLVEFSREELLLLGFGRKSVSSNNPDFRRAKRIAADLLDALEVSSVPVAGVPSP